MELFFPAQTLSLLQVFAPCFTAPSFAYFRAYVWALMVVEGRKCVTRLARCAFFHPRDLSSWERFRAEHRWSLTAVIERLVTLVVTTPLLERLHDALWPIGHDALRLPQGAAPLKRPSEAPPLRNRFNIQPTADGLAGVFTTDSCREKR